MGDAGSVGAAGSLAAAGSLGAAGSLEGVGCPEGPSGTRPSASASISAREIHPRGTDAGLTSIFAVLYRAAVSNSVRPVNATGS